MHLRNLPVQMCRRSVAVGLDTTCICRAVVGEGGMTFEEKGEEDKREHLGRYRWNGGL
jgi:hypothetical protein